MAVHFKRSKRCINHDKSRLSEKTYVLVCIFSRLLLVVVFEEDIVVVTMLKN